MIALALASRLRKLAVEACMAPSFDRRLSLALDRAVVELEAHDA